jgi:hydrogenase maturation protease
MKKVLVLGIGNRLMMDDGIGIHIVEMLKKKNKKTNVKYIVGETDIYYCMEKLNKSSYNIIVDAAILNNIPGSVSIIPLKQVLESSIQLFSSHETAFSGIKSINNSIEGILIGIQPYKIGFSMDLSNVLQKQLTGILAEVEVVIEKYAGNK